MIHLKILAWLLHHANRKSKAPEFYAIKDKILTNYGTHIGFDVQHFEGKKCHSCNGTGNHYRYDRHGFVYDVDCCWKCLATGWYKPASWVLLYRIDFKGYIFHKPYKRVYEKPELETAAIIEGYVDHPRTKYGTFALTVLYLLYDRHSYWHKGLYSFGCGWPWRLYWYWPRNWWHTIMHILTRRGNSEPAKRIKAILKGERPLFKPRIKPQPVNDDLPF